MHHRSLTAASAHWAARSTENGPSFAFTVFRAGMLKRPHRVGTSLNASTRRASGDERRCQSERSQAVEWNSGAEGTGNREARAIRRKTAARSGEEDASLGAPVSWRVTDDAKARASTRDT